MILFGENCEYYNFSGLKYNSLKLKRKTFDKPEIQLEKVKPILFIPNYERQNKTFDCG